MMTYSPEPANRTTRAISLPDATWARLGEIAAKAGISVDEAIRLVVLEHLERAGRAAG